MENNKNIFLTLKDEDGILLPLKGLWRKDDNLKYYQPEIDKFMIKGEKEGFSVVEIEIKEITK